MTPDAARAATDRLAAAVTAAHIAMEGKGPGTPQWHAFFAAKDRWVSRPLGRDAAPGDLTGPHLPGEHPAPCPIQCRRCFADCSLEGHPYGCPRTPIDRAYSGHSPLRSCYCGQTLVVAPDTFGPCCEDTPPVRIPGGCRWCGSDLCRVNDPDDLPERGYYVDARHPEMGDSWVHPRCVDDRLLTRPVDPAMTAGVHERVAERRRKRRIPLGLINP